MSKQFRTATQTRRGARGGYPEHDDFEGLPVRQWRQEWVNVAPAAPPDTTQQNDRWAPELPFGMPKEYTLLQPHSQELLRAARSGRLYKRPAAAEEDDADADAADVKGDKKDLDPAAGGYMVKVWKQSSRNVEDISHLAKRHKNTIVLVSKASAPQIVGPTVRRVTVRRTDAAGNPYEQTVTLAEGQTVDGDIVSESIVPAPAAANTDIAAQQPTPARRRPPPPKRKAKGPGRGRKKGKIGVQVPLPRPLPTAEGGENSAQVKPETVSADGIKIEEVDGSTNQDQDTEMADASVVPSDDEEGDDGDEGDEEGEEGDEEGDRTPDVASSNPQDQDQDQEMGDSESSEVIRPSSIEESEDTPRATISEEEDITIPKSRFAPPTVLGPLNPPTHLASPRIEGSPLKNVILQSPTDPSPMISPPIASTTASFSGSSYIATSMSMDISNSGTVVTETFVSGTTTSTGGEVTEQFTSATSVDYTKPPFQGDVPGGIAESGRVEELPETVDEPQATPVTTNLDETVGEKEPEVPPPTFEISEPPPEPQAAPASSTPPKSEPAETQSVAPSPPKSPNLLPAVTADEADGVNLLSSLEMELNRQEALSSAASSVKGQKTPTPPLPGATETAPSSNVADPAPSDSLPTEPSKDAETTEPLP
ncbi:hypothetical protein B0T16DRAFT_317159 [Cercophora newfieldiana]|uniref:Uncharacterized protein n=1 Tax=Cercophora newfieldiana TaxID=92897 RepID=A0AA39YPU6_9PEZI|nr:hypothetical protein B0T16DRAFT_317159 [Cercophora newfieldiana]